MVYIPEGARPQSRSESSLPQKKRAKVDDHAKHTYPAIPACADDETTRRNLELFQQECLKPKPRSDIMKKLLTRTFPTRRDTILNSNSSVMDTLNHLKKSTYVS